MMVPVDKKSDQKNISKIEGKRPIRSLREVHLNPGMDAQKNRSAVVVFIAASFILHLAAIVALYFAPSNASHFEPPKAVYIDLNTLPPGALPSVRPEKEPPRQVVESEEAVDRSAPKDAKYLGERNQTVTEETKARNVDIFRKGGAPSKAGQAGKTLSFKDLAPASAKDIAPPTKLEMEGYKQEQKRVAQAQAASPGTQAPDNAGSANNDWLKDVKEGDRTMLSTKEFVYFGYYRRIRQQLEVAWNSKLRATMANYTVGGRTLANDRNYITGVVVVLDRNGTITAVQLMQRSGAHDLDQAAVDAFNEAGPFPDPPSGLVDENGEIRIPWNFILQS